MRLVWRIVRLFLIAYLSLLLLLMFFEEGLIFFPSKYPSGDWNPLGLEVEDAHFHAADGTRIHGWYVDHKDPRVVVLFAHGNAGNITHREDVIRALHELRATLLMFDYRGYGKSEGSPDEQGILQDARAARAWLAQRARVQEAEIVLMGESIGTGVAVDLAAGEGARGLILHSACTSIPDVAAVHYRWIPVRLLMRTRLDSLHKIPSYPGPLLASHGDADEIIPYRLGQALFAAAPDPDKRFVTIPRGLHNDPLTAKYYRELDAFFTRLERE